MAQIKKQRKEDKILKFYVENSIVWFIIFVVEGILFKKEFNEAQDKVNNGKNIKKDNWFKTIIIYFLVSFIPVIRFLLFYGKVYMTFWTDSYIKTLKDMKKKIKEKEKSNGKRNEHK